MAVAPLMEQTMDADKLSYEIFSILESKFLFGGYDVSPTSTTGDMLSLPATPMKTNTTYGKVRILSIDGGARASDTMLAAAALASLETSLRQRSSHSAARIADFFDVAAGSGAGGVLAAMLFTRGHDGIPLFSAEDALRFLANNHRKISSSNSKRKSFFSRRRNDGIFRRIFGDATLRDTVGPLLVPCYDLATCAPFVFSRADAVEMGGYDFRVSDVCAATCANSSAVNIASADGRTRIRAVGAAVAMGNPTAAAITHVLNNKHEFPLASSTDDLLVLSLGVGEAAAPPSPTNLLTIAGEGTVDLVDQAVAMSFGHKRTTNYLRIQGQRFRRSTATSTNSKMDEIMAQRNVESVLFRGKKIGENTNSEKLESFSIELIKEHERRKTSPVQTVAAKHVPPTRTSSATSSTALTVSSMAISASTSPR